MNPAALQAIKEFGPRMKHLQATNSKLSATFVFDSLPPEEDLPKLVEAFRDAGFFRRLIHSDYKKAKKHTFAFLVNGKKGFDVLTIGSLLGQLRAYLHEQAELKDYAKEQCRFPDGLWQGPNTNMDLFSNLAELHQWIFEHS